ncbi:hypothetical protein EIN_398110 [Entamoeba invadens IP1]|uniref:Uncharacterized protein n=1 Tax=Entamoeba invadens IP1 TaxID=370355 RepID=A0A0A1UDJ4_ENTIV|nr:hypothetical protein EIN_398110 [Entamoeba invadens IP1]ELP91881.1 hypothetical protein EIN_398110 [Entamoeba invadens IP1]|eukprot:XP_004258652.1 hypothetical protein EIN_398110 [Entamoeba invadens IP1]
MEILSILYSRDLTHDELVSFRRRFLETFTEFQKQNFPNSTPEHFLQLENRLKQQQQQQLEALEKERRARLANQEKTCTACGKKTTEWKKGVGMEEFYCIPCSLNYIKKEPL